MKIFISLIKKRSEHTKEILIYFDINNITITLLSEHYFNTF